MQGTPISLPLPLADFAKAYDGPPTDPKVVEEQQQKLQEELQKQAEEARKKLEAQQPTAAAPPPRRRAEEISRRSRSTNAKGAAAAAPFCLRGCASIQLAVARPVAAVVVAARTPRRPADGASACRTCRAAGSARRHRRCIRSPRSRRTDDRTAGPCAGALRRDRLPPFLGVVEHRIDVEHHAAERIDAVADDLADLELGDAHLGFMSLVIAA